MSTKLRYIVTGAYNTFIGYAIFALAYWALGDVLHYAVLSIIAHFFAVSHSFATQRRFVFKSATPCGPEFFRFHLAYLAMMPVGIVLLAIFHEYFALPMLLAQACALSIMVVLSYLSSKHFTFRS